MRFYLLLFALLTTAAAPARAFIFWDYAGVNTGPEDWARLSPAFAACGEGKEQSPVSITRPMPAALPALTFDYAKADTGFWLDRYTVVSLPESGATLKEGSTKWRLKEMLIRTPSEHDIAGKFYPMELQLIHENAEKRRLAVAIFLQPGKPNAALQTIIDHFPKQLKDRPRATLDWALLLPATLGYYAYDGSLASPPCTEGVAMRVLKTPIEASREQMQWLAQKIGRNARDVQPLGSRTIFESQ